MSREDDAIIAEWLGWTDCRKRAQGEWGGFTPDNYGAIIPHFTTSDADAISLLPVLVERGYNVSVSDYYLRSWVACIEQDDMDNINSPQSPTIAAAISGAVLELIGREGK